MARKETVTKKKPTVAKNKATSASRKPTTANKKPTTAQKQATPAIDLSTAPPDIKALTAIHEPHISVLPQETMEMIMSEIHAFIRDFQEWSDNNLTPTQRRRKFGAGIRNYGFIEKVADLSAANPQYAQFFDINDLRNAIKNVDMCRDLVLLLQGFQRMVSNSMLGRVHTK